MSRYSPSKETIRSPQDVGTSDGKSYEENMICGIIIIIFIFGLCGACVMKGPVVYRSKENETITIRWSTQMKTDFALINMMCEFRSDSIKIVYETIGGTCSIPDEQFAGRIHFDKDAPREAEIRLHLTRVQTEDSGNYSCFLNANFDNNRGKWRLQMTEHFILNVTTEENNNPPCNRPCTPYGERPPRGPDQTIRLGICLSVGGLVLALIVFYIFYSVRARR